MKKKILIVTSTRAEYGLLKKLIILMKKEKSFSTKLLVTGNHFEKKFGNTFNEIIQDKLKIDYKINIKIGGDSAGEIAKYFSKQSEKVSFILDQKFRPDLVILLGDRFEILSIASISKIYNIPICHLHGGETTEGSIDNKIRHAISKLSSLHFVSHNMHKRKLLKMGEKSNLIFNYGALGLNDLKNFNLSKEKIEKKIKLSINKKTFVVTFHPETLNKTTNLTISNLLNALNKFKNVNFIFTCPNMDEDHAKVFVKIKSYVKKNKNSIFIKSLGKQLYFNLLKIIDGVIGNSSSGIIEVPSFNIPTINIGDRQKGRLQSKTIYNSGQNSMSIYNLISKIIRRNIKFKGKNYKKIKKNKF